MLQATLRRARPEDASKIAGVHTIARRLSMPYLPVLHTGEETIRWISDQVLPNVEVWVAEEHGEMIGYFALEDERLDQLYVLPQWQRRGVGALLMAKAQELRPDGLVLYCFAVNAPARAFYERRGFVSIEFSDGRRNEERLPDVLYRWIGRAQSDRT
jgi:GNAT superfamily N-acetyltransferase